MSAKSTVKTVVMMMIIVLAGKTLGLVREMLFGFHYGTGSTQAAAFTVANQIPKNFLDAMFASVISASFIPVFNDYYEKEGRVAAYRLTCNFLNIVLVFSAATTAIGMIFSFPMVNWYAAGYSYETKLLSADLLRIMFPILAISSVTYTLVGVVQSLGEFMLPAAMSVASNMVIMIYYLFFIDSFGIYGLAVVFVLAWLSQLVIQLPFLIKNGFNYKFFMNFNDPGIKQIVTLMLPVMISTWIQPVNITINSKVASGLFDGSGAGVNALSYANTLYSVIMGVFILSVANVIFPRLAKQNTNKDTQGFGDTIHTTMHVVLYFLLPMTVGLIILAEPLVRLVFQINGGMFDAFSTAITAKALAFYCVGIPGFGIQTILSRGFYALKDGVTPLVTSVVAIAINLVLSLLLVGPMDVGGVALASSVSILLVAAMMIRVMAKSFRMDIQKDVAKMAAASAATALCAVFLRNFFYSFEDTLAVRLAAVFVPSVFGGGVYFGFTYFLGLSEPRLVIDNLQKKVKK